MLWLKRAAVMGVHGAPPAKLTKTPWSNVPANTVSEIAGSMASAVTLSVGRPLLAAAHVAPPSVVLETPAFLIAAYRVFGALRSSASATMAELTVVGSPVPIGTQVPPAFVVLKIPEDDPIPVPAD